MNWVFFLRCFPPVGEKEMKLFFNVMDVFTEVKVTSKIVTEFTQ